MANDCATLPTGTQVLTQTLPCWSWDISRGDHLGKMVRWCKGWLASQIDHLGWVSLALGFDGRGLPWLLPPARCCESWEDARNDARNLLVGNPKLRLMVLTCSTHGFPGLPLLGIPGRHRTPLALQVLLRISGGNRLPIGGMPVPRWPLPRHGKCHVAVTGKVLVGYGSGQSSNGFGRIDHQFINWWTDDPWWYCFWWIDNPSSPSSMLDWFTSGDFFSSDAQGWKVCIFRYPCCRSNRCWCCHWVPAMLVGIPSRLGAICLQQGRTNQQRGKIQREQQGTTTIS